MTVYIVWYNDFQGNDEFCGVFSSEEKAQEFIARYVPHDQKSMRIEERQLDDY